MKWIGNGNDKNQKQYCSSIAKQRNHLPTSDILQKHLI